MSIDANSSKQQMIKFLRNCTKGDVVDVVKYINDEIDVDIIDIKLKISGTADELVDQLSYERQVTQSILFEAVDAILETEDDEDEDEDEEESEGIEIDPSSTKQKMCDYLEFESTKEQIVEIINYMNEEINADELEAKFNTSGTKESLVQQLREERELTRDLLYEAIDAVIPDTEEEDEDVNFLEGLAASPSPFPLPPPPPSAKVPTLSIDTKFLELEIEESCCLLPRPAVCIATLPVDTEEGAATA
jgi:hypothetical protein